jgi:hypothetical protein
MSAPVWRMVVAVERYEMAPVTVQRQRRLERDFISLSQQHANYLAVR